jgi:hypothetical protein
MRTFEQAEEKLAGRNSRKIGNNTYLMRRGANTIAVMLHATDVVTYHRDGRIVLNSGGWQTPTTKSRLNAYGPAGSYVHQSDYKWYVAQADGSGAIPFRDYMTFRLVDGIHRAAAELEVAQAGVR